MEEVVKTHLPLLAWNWHEGRYQLIYDDLPVGELAIDENGRGWARYHDTTWLVDPSGHGEYRLRDGTARKTIGSMHIDTEGEPEEGRLEVQGKVYRCLRDSRKIPARVTITGPQGQPLLQFHEEEEDKGRIQIDNQLAAASSDFEVLVLWGMHLYLTASPNLRVSPTRQINAARPERVRRASRISDRTPMPTWLPWTVGGLAGLLAVWIWKSQRSTAPF